MPGVRAGITTAISFPREDLELVDRLDAYCRATGAPRSEAIRRCIRAVLLNDEEALRLMRRFRSPATLTGAKAATA
jgi:metal-responsive CopG/Arc/MetJ family transcriptional regulator